MARTRLPACIVVALIVLCAGGGCSSGRHATGGPRPSAASAQGGSTLTAKDLGSGWLLTQTTTQPSLDEECESGAFDGVVPEHVVPQQATLVDFVRRTARPGDQGVLDVREYLLRFPNRAAAEQSLTAYGDLVSQCIRQPRGEQVARKTKTGWLLRRPMAGLTELHGARGVSTLWQGFELVGNQAVWLIVSGGSERDVERIVAKAARDAQST